MSTDRRGKMSDNDGLDIFVSAEKRVEGRMNSPVEIESARIIREMFYQALIYNGNKFSVLVEIPS